MKQTRKRLQKQDYKTLMGLLVLQYRGCFHMQPWNRVEYMSFRKRQQYWRPCEMIYDDYDGQWYPGMDGGLSFLDTYLTVEENSRKITSNRETDSTGDRTRTLCVSSYDVIPKPQRWSIFLKIYLNCLCWNKCLFIYSLKLYMFQESYRVIYILGAATDGCRNWPCLACPPLHGASNCRCSQTLAPFFSHCNTDNFVNTPVHVNKTMPRR